MDITYSTDILINIVNMMGIRTRIHDRQMHRQLKVDLVEHIWIKFGRDKDNNSARMLLSNYSRLFY